MKLALIGLVGSAVVGMAIGVLIVWPANTPLITDVHQPTKVIEPTKVINEPLPTLVSPVNPTRIRQVRGSLQAWPNRCVVVVDLGDEGGALHLRVDPSVCADDRVWRYLDGQQ